MSEPGSPRTSAPQPEDAARAELERLRELLRQSQARQEALEDLAEVVRHNPSPVLRLSRSGTVLWHNPATAAVFGRSLVGEAVGSIFPAMERTRIQTLGPQSVLTAEARSGERLFQCEIRMDKGGNHVLLYARDVTALDQEKERYASLFRNAPVGIFEARPDGGLATVNPRFAAGFGYPSADDLLAERDGLAGLFEDPDDFRLLRGRLERDGEVLDMEARLRARDGRSVWASLNVRAERDGRGICRIKGFAQDITARVKARQVLHEAEARLRAVVDNAQALIFIKDLRGRYTFANALLEKFLGRPAAEVVGRTDADFLPPEAAAAMAEFDREVLATRKPGQREMTLPRPDGIFHFLTAKVPLLDVRGEPIAICGISTDITEQKRLERLRQDAERMAMHDLKSPLISATYVPRLLRGDGNLTPRQVQLLDELEHTAGRVLAVLNMSSRLFKLEVGAYTLGLKRVDLLGALAHAQAELRRLMDERRLRVDVRVDGQPPRPGQEVALDADPELLAMLLANLLKNALEASPDGATVQAEAHDGERVRLTIRNQGAVPQEVRGRFFEKYATSGKAWGTGLGAYSAKLIAEAHGGSASMRTSDGDGTAVTVELPRCASGRRSADNA